MSERGSTSADGDAAVNGRGSTHADGGASSRVPSGQPAPALRLLAWTVITPLLVALGVALWALLAEQRALTEAADVAVAVAAHEALQTPLGLAAARLVAAARDYEADSVALDPALDALLERTDRAMPLPRRDGLRRAAAPIIATT